MQGEDRDRVTVTVTYPQHNGNNQPHKARGNTSDEAQCTAENEDDGCKSKESGPGCSKENEDHSISLRW